MAEKPPNGPVRAACGLLALEQFVLRSTGNCGQRGAGGHAAGIHAGQDLGKGGLVAAGRACVRAGGQQGGFACGGVAAFQRVVGVQSSHVPPELRVPSFEPFLDFTKLAHVGAVLTACPVPLRALRDACASPGRRRSTAAVHGSARDLPRSSKPLPRSVSFRSRRLRLSCSSASAAAAEPALPGRWGTPPRGGASAARFGGGLNSTNACAACSSSRP
jgi:hypothetical protein